MWAAKYHLCFWEHRLKVTFWTFAKKRRQKKRSAIKSDAMVSQFTILGAVVANRLNQSEE
jgi:hypothetical protein